MSRTNLDVAQMLNVLASAAAEAVSTMGGAGSWDSTAGELSALVDALDALQDEHLDALAAAAERAAERVGLEFSADADALEEAQRDYFVASASLELDREGVR